MDRRLRGRFLRNVGYYARRRGHGEDRSRALPIPGLATTSSSGPASPSRQARTGRVGGLPVLPAGEDVALGRALRRADIEIRHSPEVRVFTSGRLRGRTPARTLAQLTSWSILADDDAAPPVPNATSVVTRAVCRRALRDQWRRARAGHGACLSEVARLADVAGLSRPWLREASCRPRRSGCCSTPWRSRRPGPDKAIGQTCARRSSSSAPGWRRTGVRRRSPRFRTPQSRTAAPPTVGAGRGHPRRPSPHGARRDPGGRSAPDYPRRWRKAIRVAVARLLVRRMPRGPRRRRSGTRPPRPSSGPGADRQVLQVLDDQVTCAPEIEADQ